MLVAMRLDAMITNTPTRKIFPDIANVEMKIKLIAKKSGNLQIKYLPSGSTVLDIKTYLKELEIKSKKKIDCILIDKSFIEISKSVKYP
jgi:hypothetical protein